MVQLSTSSSITSFLLVLCCWCALTHSMAIKENTALNSNNKDVLNRLDDENTKRTTTTSNNHHKNMDSVTEELARSLMDHLYDELKKRTDELSDLHQQYRRSDGERPPTFNKPPGLWGRRDTHRQPGHVPGLWGREISSNGDESAWSRSADNGPIPGMWGDASVKQ